MVVQLAPAGLLFGADRNVTTQMTLKDGTIEIIVTGQSQRPKVLRWPNHEVIVGYVGQAELAGRPADEWLYHSFIGKHLQFKDLDELADALTNDLNALYPTFKGEPMVLHLGGFEVDGGQWKPRVYFIRNTTALTANGAYVVGTKFDCSEEISDTKYFHTKPGNQIRAEVAWPHYFSFRQGYDLGVFNTIDQALRLAMNSLIAAGLRPTPTTLDELADHVEFQIHGYGAYFAAFFSAAEQFVGGGADVVTAAWP
jgi:hypothetical protein